MESRKFPNQKITFESFLCCTPARDYIYQDNDYDKQIRNAAKIIHNAEYVLIGASAGMSTAAGAQYGGKFFEENFGEFQKKYGKGCHDKTYDAVELFNQMDKVRTACRIPSSIVPKCPVCGGPMDMNLRKDAYFVQDNAWYEAEERFSDYLSEAMEGMLFYCRHVY